MSKLIIFAIMACGGVAMAQDGDIAAGKTKAVTCFACHGNNGNSTNAMYPGLAGKKADFLFDRMVAYKKGAVKTENASMMKPMMDGLSEKDMKDLAAFFSSQKPVDPAESKSRRRR